MENKSEKKTVPVLPFDITIGESMSMYDNMAYTRDVAICGNDMVKKESGNVIKFFRCSSHEPHSIGGDKQKNNSKKIG